VNSENIISDIILKRLTANRKTWLPVKQDVLIEIAGIDPERDADTTEHLTEAIERDPDLILDFMEHIATVRPMSNRISSLKHGIVLIGARATISFVKSFYSKGIFKDFGYFFDKKNLIRDHMETATMLEISSVINTHPFLAMFKNNFRIMVNYKNLGKNLALQFLNLELKNKNSSELKKITKKEAWDISSKHNRYILDLIMESWSLPTSFKYKFGLGEKNPTVQYLTVYNYYNIIDFILEYLEKLKTISQADFTVLRNKFHDKLIEEQFISMKSTDATNILRNLQKFVVEKYEEKIKEYGLDAVDI